MNIFGIGTDIVNTVRIKKNIKKNQKFKKKLFTKFEINICDKRKNQAECFAKRFAAKEALFKAIGSKNKLQFQDVEIRNNKSGAPNFRIKGNSLKNLKEIFKKDKFKIHLSLSDDKPWAVASVIVFTLKK
tara:strand:- start:4011 stop:4400 length:390 start_codon:yes stop_codon:yes gene_type:complete